MQANMGIPEIGSKKNFFFKSEKLFRASSATQGYWGVKCHPGVLGRQMPPGGIGASNATPNYWGVKGQGRQRARKPQGVKNQGRQKALYG